MSEIEPTGMTSADALRLVKRTLEQLERHLDDPDNSSLSAQGMLEITRDRISTLYALMVNLIPASDDSRLEPAGPRCATCSGPIRWSEQRQDWTHRGSPAVMHEATLATIGPERAASMVDDVISLLQTPGGNVTAWTDTRDDDGRWLAGSSACPRGCSHVLMAHRTDVGCVTCDCEHRIPGRGAELIDRAKSHVLPADLAEQYGPEF